MKKECINPKSDEITEYSKSQIKQFADICDKLRNEIEKTLSNASSRIYYSMPVWFINGDPIVGYNASSKYVNLLFWSGQSFGEPDLIAAGKFKAAQIRYHSVKDIDVKALRRWLNKSKKYIWNYQNIRKNTGKLVLKE